MIRPRRSRSMPLAARLASRKEPVRLVSITDDQSSSDIRSTQGVGGDAGVGDQHLDRAVGRLDLGEGGLDRGGVGDVAAHVERALGRAAAAVVTATRSPWATKASAMARPMPRLPPVTRTDRPAGSVFASLTSPTLAITPG